MKLPQHLGSLLTTQHGYVTHRQLIEHGVGKHDLAALLRDASLRPVWRGIYSSSPEPTTVALQGLDRARAIAIAYGGGVAVSHETALLAHGLPTYGTDLRRSCLVRCNAGDTVRSPLVHIRRSRRPLATVLVDAAPAVAEAVAFAQVACDLGVEAGVVAGDAILHRGTSSRAELASAVGALGARKGVQRARTALDLLEPKTESPGESLLRLIVQGAGIGLEPQYIVETVDGHFVARVDFLVSGTRIVLEYDGQEKYADEDAKENALYLEKLRQEAIERQDYVVIRANAADLRDPAHLLHRLRALIARQAA